MSPRELAHMIAAVAAALHVPPERVAELPASAWIGALKIARMRGVS